MAVEIARVESRADLERSVAVWNAVFPRRRLTVDDVAGWREALALRHELLAYRDGELAGAAHAAVEPDQSHPSGSAYVLPEHRGHGVGDRLYAAIGAWAVEHGFERLRVTVEADDEASLGWARRRGFVEQSREGRLVLDLRSARPPRVEPPAGVEIVSWAERPELARELYEVYREAEPDIPGEGDHPLPSFDDWLRVDMSGPGDRPEATFVALAGGEVVGYAKLSLTDAAPERAFHDLTGVRRAWRGRGIARALKARQVAWAAERGYRFLETMNEERNEPIRRLNEAFGYRPEPGRVTMVGPASPDEPVVLVEYDPVWAERFEAERRLLEPVLAPWLAGGIHHFGSTAVPGLAAKPTVDILAGVRDLDEARAAIEPLRQVGYEHHPYRPWHLWFCKPSRARRRFHLHLAEASHPELAARLAFRDALRADPELRREYAELKRRLADAHPGDRAAYTAAKTAFVRRVTASAT